MLRTGRGKVPAAYTPKRLYGTKRAFVIRSKGGGPYVLAIRDRGKKERAFTPLYVLVKTAKLKHRFDYFERAMKSVAKNFPINIRAALSTVHGRTAKAGTRFR